MLRFCVDYLLVRSETVSVSLTLAFGDTRRRHLVIAHPIEVPLAHPSMAETLGGASIAQNDSAQEPLLQTCIVTVIFPAACSKIE